MRMVSYCVWYRSVSYRSVSYRIAYGILSYCVWYLSVSFIVLRIIYRMVWYLILIVSFIFYLIAWYLVSFIIVSGIIWYGILCFSYRIISYAYPCSLLIAGTVAAAITVVYSSFYAIENNFYWWCSSQRLHSHHPFHKALMPFDFAMLVNSCISKDSCQEVVRKYDFPVQDMRLQLIRPNHLNTVRIRT